jgi:hypothetical protein
MDAVGAPNAEGLALLEGTALANLAELLAVIKQDVRCLHQLVTQRGVAKVRAGHAKVDPAAGLGVALGDVCVDVTAHVGEEGNDIMVGDGLDGVDLILIKGGVLANPGCLLLGDANLAKLGLRLACEDLDLLPDGVLVLQREDVAHFGTGIAIDHLRSFRSEVFDALILPRQSIWMWRHGAAWQQRV